VFCSGILFRHPSVCSLRVFEICCHFACLFRSLVPVFALTVLFVRSACSGTFLLCAGLFGYIVPTSECLFVTFVRNMLAFRLSVPECCFRVCSDCLVCSFSVFVSLHALFVSVREYCSDIRVVCSLRCSIQFSRFSRFVLRFCSRHAFSPCPSDLFVR
jgi:hypothetical protein